MNDTADRAPILAARPTHVRYLVLAALCIITTVNYIQRNSVGGAETTIRADLALERSDTGAAMGVFFLTYALCQVPSGWLAQRWGGRRMLALYAAGWSIVMAFTAAATNLPALLTARGAMGALQAGIFPCATMILAAWYPATRRGLTSAFLNSFMLMGGVIASVVTGLLIGPFGWRWLFLLYAVPGLAWAAWFAWWFRNRPQEHPGVNPAELAIIQGERPADAGWSETLPPKQESSIPAPGLYQPADAGRSPGGPSASETRQREAEITDLVGRVVKRSTPWLAIALSPALWLICLQQFCRSGALRFFDQWLPTYLQEARGQSLANANFWTSLPMWAGVVGGPLGGLLSDFVLTRTGSRRAARQGVAIGSVLVAVVIYCSAYFVADVRGAMLLTCLGLLIMTFSSPVAYALSMDMGGRNLGVIFGIMNMAGNFGSFAFTTFLPHVIRWRGWDAALLVFVAMHLVAVVCWLPLNPNGVIGERPDAQSDSRE